MATQRKDKRGYVLRKGESCRTDGRYCYSYTDIHHERKYIYANTLAELREKEKKVVRALEDGIDPGAAERITINEMFEKYMLTKHDLERSTYNGYIITYRNWIAPYIGNRKIGRVSYSDIKEFYYRLMKERGLKAATVEHVHTLLHPTFKMAVRDGYLRTNPTDDVMLEIKKSKLWVKEPRISLTVPQQLAFIRYIADSTEFRGWLPIFTVLLGTGMRIGECTGLTWNDVDLEKRLINVNHSLNYRPIDMTRGWDCDFYVSSPKTKAGNRVIPMLDEVYDALVDEWSMRNILKAPKVTIDGYSNFIFITSTGKPYTGSSVNNAIDRIVKAYNKEEEVNAMKEKREPVLLPHFSAHNLRHTFCTRLCENESNVKIIQSIMGHADISTTMNIYADATTEKKQEIVSHLQGKIPLI